MKAAEAIQQLHARVLELEKLAAAQHVRLLRLEDSGEDLDFEVDLNTETPAPSEAAQPTGNEPQGQAVSDQVPQITVQGDDVTFAAPNKRQRLMRRQLIPSMGFEHWTTPTNDDAPAPPPQGQIAAAYEEGGPLWLYTYDRDYVVSLPPEVHQAMVQDVLAAPDNETARWFGADLLKGGLEEQASVARHLHAEEGVKRTS